MRQADRFMVNGKDWACLRLCLYKNAYKFYICAIYYGHKENISIVVVILPFLLKISSFVLGLTKNVPLLSLKKTYGGLKMLTSSRSRITNVMWPQSL